MKHGRSTGTPTKAEADRIVAAKEGPCMACFSRAVSEPNAFHPIVYGCDYNHAKSGNIRRGHMEGYALCGWHHRRLKLDEHTFRSMTDVYGPSLMDGSRLFHETYGSDDYLIALQTKVIQETSC